MNNMTRFTFWGICQYEPTILEAIQVPAPLDRQILIDEIMKRSGQLYVYQQEPSFLKRNIENWFTRNRVFFERQISALMEEFSPIENYDRYETLIETPDITSKTTFDGSNSTETETKNVSTGEVSAFNSDEYEPNTKGTGEGSDKAVTTYDSSNTTKETGTRKHENHIHGNIGVTQATDMVRNFVELYSFDLYENIAQRFEKEFLIQIY